jgi:uncharacterized repeat protein (TIGR03803 family)
MRLPAASAALALAAVLVSAVITTRSAQAQTFTTLYSFDSTHGQQPYAGLIQGTDGNFYGTTGYGGANSDGTVYKITPGGTLTTLYNFCSQSNCADGDAPSGELVQGTDGNFYGATQGGGANGDGTVFRITPGGTLTTLYTFCSQSNCADGDNPYGGLIQGTDGNFYGTTLLGGANSYGTVFKITPSGTLTTLHSFDSTDGDCPNGALIQATYGNFYGTTVFGGALNCATSNYSGCGTVFKITPGGTLTTLYTFCSQGTCTDGEWPYAGLAQGTDGNFYGTTFLGGVNGDGTVFRITPGGTLTTLYNFCSQSNCADGSQPYGGLVQGTDGNFYGTNFAANGDGTIFRITASGTLTTLHGFDGTDGQYPEAALMQATNGTFYGTTFYGGANALGTVFSLSVGLRPFVETQPTFGKTGTAVRILGAGLTGATAVTFNGTPATFTVVSATEITTMVPTGATTGKVQVTTPIHTLTSNKKFVVKP